MICWIEAIIYISFNIFPGFFSSNSMLLYSYFYNNILWLFNRISIHNIHFLYLLIPLICLGKEHLKNNVSQVNFQTHLGVILDAKLTFEEHLKNVFNKTNKTIGLLKKLSNLLPRQVLVTIYKTFISWCWLWWCIPWPSFW